MLALIAAVLGFVAGCVTGAVNYFTPNPAHYPFLAKNIPLPHHVPSQRFGAAFRFAMVHDVIHERFPRHGQAYYKERNKQTRAKLAKLAANDQKSFPLTDDLAIGLRHLDRTDEAIALMRAKLARQQAMKYTGRDLYTTSANLGTLLIHANYARASAGDVEAVKRLREGVALIRKSVELNPGAHFGREKWQAALAEFHLAAMEKSGMPETRRFLEAFDFVGNRLDLAIDEISFHERHFTQTDYGRATTANFGRHGQYSFHPAYSDRDRSLDDPDLWSDLQPMREYITKAGAENGWSDASIPSHRKPVPFDEPMLGVVDMWRQGGAANPHLALAVGETMLRVGQRYIAWTAYERTAKMADRFWPDPDAQQFLRDHCRRRQEQIEKTFRIEWRRHFRPESADTIRTRFNDELAYGEQYQKDYQRYETDKIAAGGDINDEHFFDAFHSNREPIASPVGEEEWFVMVPRNEMQDYANRRVLACGVFGAGLGALGMALLLKLISFARRRAGDNLEVSS
jgi:hypothetical protein